MPIIIDTGGAEYTSLTKAVKDWVGRMDSKFIDHVPEFIRLAEVRIWDRVRLAKGITQPQTITIIAGQSYAELPSDFLQASRGWNAADGYRVDYVSADQLPSANGSDSCPDPYKFSTVGRTFYWGQVAGDNTDLTFTYYWRPAPVEVASGVDLWLIQDRPNIYLYAALLEASIFIKNSAKVGEFGSLLDRAIADAEMADQVARYPRDQRLAVRAR